jgi:flagellum-specific peptidoglycan hydrolase FlgJ
MKDGKDKKGTIGVNMDRAEYFPLAVVQQAQKCQTDTGLRASVTLAQWAQESGYGKYNLSANNFFGIKWVSSCGFPYVIKLTREVINGKSVMVQAKFIKFPTDVSCFEYHAKLLTNPTGPYSRALPYLSSPIVFIQKMAPIYATDGEYAHNLITLINQWSLLDFDRF